MIREYIRKRAPRVVIFETTHAMAHVDREATLHAIYRELSKQGVAAAGQRLMWRSRVLCPAEDLNWHCSRKRIYDGSKSPLTLAMR